METPAILIFRTEDVYVFCPEHGGSGGQYSVFSITTHWGLGGLGFKSWWEARFLGNLQLDPDIHPHSFLYNRYRFNFTGCKVAGAWCRHPFLLPELRMVTAIPLVPLCACLAHSRTSFTFTLHAGSSFLHSIYNISHLRSRGEFRPRQTRHLPRAVDLKGRLLSCQSY